MNERTISKDQEELFLNNQYLISCFLKKITYIKYSDYEDLFSIGKVGLLKATLTFDNTKNVIFPTYASKCISNEIYTYFREKKLYLNDISLDAPIGGDSEGNEITLRETISDSTDFTEKLEKKETFIMCFNVILNLLKPKERLVMLYKISGMNQSAIANELNISQSYISRMEKKIINEIRNYLYSTQQVNGPFSITEVNEATYKISFSFGRRKNTKSFILSETLPDNLKIKINGQRIIVKLPLENPASYYFLAKIITVAID